jgi:hypothetical protein
MNPTVLDLDCYAEGRYLKLPVEQRICQLCHMDVEDEFHFLMNCDKLIHERVTLFRNISDPTVLDLDCYADSFHCNC